MHFMEDKTKQRLDTIAKELEKRRSEHGSGTGRSRSARRFLRRFVMVLALVFFVLAGIFIFNFLRLNSDLVEGHIKQGIIPNLTQGRFDMNIGAVSGNLINGVELENVLIQNPHFKTSSTLMTIPKISLQYSVWGIFWGRITLEKLRVENPVLTLKRNENGRAIWDFSALDEDDGKNQEKAMTKWQQREEAQALADNYLADILVENLSILIPAPDQLIVDEFLSRLTSFPKKTYQFTGINLSVRKYPAEKFISHILRVSLPQNSDFLRFQVTRSKADGNFTVTFDAIGQNFNLAVENLGASGRKVNFYDGRMKDRLNLEWVLARERKSLPEKVTGLNGVLRIPDFAAIFSGILGKDSIVAGSLDLAFKTAAAKSLYESDIDFKLSNGCLKIPFVPEIQSIDADISSRGRVAEIRKLQVKINDIESIHRGSIDYVNEADIKASMNANIMGDTMQMQARYKREDQGLHRIAAGVKRNSGEAVVDFKRHIVGKNVIYRDFKIEAGLIQNGKAVEILPLNLMPEDLSNQILAWFKRIDLVGPFRVVTSFPTLDDWRSSELELRFNGSRIVNQLNPDDFIELNGGAVLAGGVFNLENLRADIDNFALSLQGKLQLVATAPFVTDYEINVGGGIEGGKDFSITAERLQKSLGLANRPDFDSIELRGQDLLQAHLATTAATNRISLNLDKMRLVRRKKPLWLDNLIAELTVGPYNLVSGILPGATEMKVKGDFFGVNVESHLKADLAGGSIDELGCKGGGSNFSQIIQAIVSQPEGQQFFKKYPMNINGSFNFSFLGKGLLKNPELQGWVKFPSLGFSYADVSARLPFHAQVSTAGEKYNAEIEAGKASLQVGQVTFDLGATKARAEALELFSAKDPQVSFTAETNVFAAAAKVTGTIKPASRKIAEMKLDLSSNKIETLAKEIARIGQFKIPFELNGKFKADARLSGDMAAPDSSGKIEFSSIDLNFPLQGASKKTVLTARKLGGRAEFNKKGNDFFSLELKKIVGKILDADVELDGAANLKRQKNGFKPSLDRLNARVAGLKAAELADYLISQLLPAEYAGAISVNSGIIDGLFSLSGSTDRLVALGQASIREGAVGYRALPEKFTDLSAELKFEGRTDSAYARVAVENLSTTFGRSRFKINQGYIEDPLKSGNISLVGAVEKVFPKDLLAMFGGLQVGAISFPEEGWLDGRLEVEGTLYAPQIKSSVSSSKMKLAYTTDGVEYAVPIGENQIGFSYNPGNGALIIEKALLKILNGEINFKEIGGVFSADKPFSFNAAGEIRNIDIGQLSISDSAAFKGIISGAVKAAWEPGGARDAVFNLDFKNIFIPKIPIVDEAAMDKVGIDFIEQPDFREGQLNFYVTSDEEAGYAGKLLIADGLFAGPHMRLELGNSEFNPSALRLSGRLMLNPQSLRQTTIGKKLGRLSATIQDKKTGVPYVDLNLAGTWDKPELMAKNLQKTTEKRAKKNFINKLFGSRGPHKASVEELMKWFPGWQKGM